MVKFYIY